MTTQTNTLQHIADLLAFIDRPNIHDNPQQLTVLTAMDMISNSVSCIPIDNGYAQINWQHTQHDTIQIHVFKVHQELPCVVLYRAIIKPGFIGYKLTVDQYQTFGDYASAEYRDAMEKEVDAELRAAL